ncbi:MAG TPA: hypothetical protein VEX15_10290 [Nocardioidaceae bacterium]|nr:hypothetical protein [Nocardioidaceae bacterium]
MKKVFLHVGAPKTGTSHLQDLLYVNREGLRAKGVLYPADRFDHQFLGAIDLLDKSWGGLEAEAGGAWRWLVQRANGFDGTVILSHEVFAGATAEQAKAAIEDLEGEVHLVYSARDLARQIPAEWQEGVKHRRQLTYAKFCADLRAERPKTAMAKWFWSVQHWPDVLARWSGTLPADRVHVLTVPPPDSPRSTLMRRFLDLFEIDESWLPLDSERANVSLGGAETAVIRKINELLPPDRLEGPVYRRYVREVLVHQTLARTSTTSRIQLPPNLVEWVDETTERWIGDIDAAGYDVVGDLEELQRNGGDEPWYDPDAAPAVDQLRVAYDAIEVLLREIARLESDRPGPEQAPTRRQRLKHRLVAAAGRWRVMGWALRGYRRLRRRR